jgi:ribosomal protein S18 acetylase RimI-like enzyme
MLYMALGFEIRSILFTYQSMSVLFGKATCIPDVEFLEVLYSMHGEVDCKSATENENAASIATSMHIFDGSKTSEIVELYYPEHCSEVHFSIAQTLVDQQDDLQGEFGFLGAITQGADDQWLVAYAMLHAGELVMINAPRQIRSAANGLLAECLGQTSLQSTEQAASEQIAVLVQLARQRWNPEIIQSIVAIDSSFDRDALEQVGFQRLATLLQMRRDINVDERSVDESLSTDHDWKQLSLADRNAIEAWLNSTYDGTFDCPELTGIRTTSKVFDGYWLQATGTSAKRSCNELALVPQWWMLVDEATESSHANNVRCGVMLSPIDADVWELSYLGVAKEHRNQGLGKAALQHSIQVLASLKIAQVVTHVDVRNQPAINMYSKSGFIENSFWDVYFMVAPAK